MIARRWPILLVAGALAAWALYHLVLGLQSHESQLRRRVDKGLAAFNAGKAGSLTDLLAEDYRDRDTGMDKRQAQLFLIQFFTRLKAQHGEIPWRGELVPEGEEGGGLAITIEEGEPLRAALRFRVRFFDTRPSAPGSRPDDKAAATIEVSGRCTRASGEWTVLDSSHRTIEGRAPF